MLTMGGSPTVSVSPVNSIAPESGLSKDITGKPCLDEFLKINPVDTNPNVGNPRLVLNLSLQYKKSPLINLNQAFNMNPINFTDPFGDAVMPGVDPEVVKSAYAQFIQSGDSPDTALKKLEDYGYIDSDICYKHVLAASVHAEPGAQVLGTAAYIMFEFSPAGIFKDVVSLPFGYDLVSGEKMKWWQKALIATPFAAKAISKGGKLINSLLKGYDEGSDLAKATIKGLQRDELSEALGAGTGKGYGVYPVETPKGIRWKDPNTGKFVKAPSQGKVVIGHFPVYKEVALQIDATYLQFPKLFWKKMWKSKKFNELWEINRIFLREALNRGDEIIFATDWGKKWSYFARELWYLRKQGINVFEKIKKLW